MSPSLSSSPTTPPLRMICLIVVCIPRPSSFCLLVVAPPRPSTSRRLLIVDLIRCRLLSASPPRPLRWIVFGRHCSRRRLRQGGRRGRIVIVVSFPLLPGRRSEGRSVRQRPSIVSVAAMVAGGNNGLPWRRAGRQWLRLPVVIKRGGNYGPYAFLSLTHTTGAKIMPISPRLPHRTPQALCGSIEKNTDSLVKGMILFDQGGGGRGGGC
jgi:hypothetical protein